MEKKFRIVIFCSGMASFILMFAINWVTPVHAYKDPTAAASGFADDARTASLEAQKAAQQALNAAQNKDKASSKGEKDKWQKLADDAAKKASDKAKESQKDADLAKQAADQAKSDAGKPYDENGHEYTDKEWQDHKDAAAKAGADAQAAQINANQADKADSDAFKYASDPWDPAWMYSETYQEELKKDQPIIEIKAEDLIPQIPPINTADVAQDNSKKSEGTPANSTGQAPAGTSPDATPCPPSGGPAPISAPVMSNPSLPEDPKKLSPWKSWRENKGYIYRKDWDDQS